VEAFDGLKKIKMSAVTMETEVPNNGSKNNKDHDLSVLEIIFG
jgi:hypothetical protein